VRRALVAGLAFAALLGAPPVSRALDPPHDASRAIECGSCHITHDAPGGSLRQPERQPVPFLPPCGGQASAKALATSNQALPVPGLPRAGPTEPPQVGLGAIGRHRWRDVDGQRPVRRCVWRPLAKTYTLTISVARDAETARFN
jgi:hypothetical protein